MVAGIRDEPCTKPELPGNNSDWILVGFRSHQTSFAASHNCRWGQNSSCGLSMKVYCCHEINFAQFWQNLTGSAIILDLATNVAKANQKQTWKNGRKRMTRIAGEYPNF
jgi:hypothetical protein